MEHYYIDVLKELKIGEILASSAENSSLVLKDVLPQLFFYFENGEKNKLKIDTAEFLLNGKVKKRNSTFIDNLEMQKFDEIYEKLVQLYNKEVNSTDILELKDIISRGIFGNLNETRNLLANDAFGDYRDNQRRYLLLLGDYYIADSLSNLSEEFGRVANMLNQKQGSVIEHFLNATDFHMEFAHLHPITNSDGRVNKLLTNLYLIRNGLNPIIITDIDKTVYEESLNAFHISGYTGAFVANMAIAAARNNVEALLERLRSVNSGSLYLSEFKNLVFYLTNNLSRAELERDIPRMFNEGKMREPNLAIAALWLSGSAKLDGRILLEGYKNNDPNIRKMALWAMANVDAHKYYSYIKAGLLDSEPSARILAIGLLTKANLLDPIIAEVIRVREKDLAVLSALAEQIELGKNSREYTEVIKKLMGSDLINVKMRAFNAFLANADPKQTAKILKDIEKEPPEAILGMGCTGFERLFDIYNDPVISDVASDKVLKFKYVRQFMLRSMSKIPKVRDFSDKYSKLCETILSDDTFDLQEKAFAFYILSTQKGFKYVSQKYNISPKLENGTLLNTALVLSYLDDFKKGKITSIEDSIFISGDQKLNITIGLGVADLLKSGLIIVQSDKMYSWVKQATLEMENSVFGSTFKLLSTRLGEKVRTTEDMIQSRRKVEGTKIKIG